MVLSLYNAVGLDGGENSDVNRLLSVAYDLGEKAREYSSGSANPIVVDGNVVPVPDIQEENVPTIGESKFVNMVPDTVDIGYEDSDKGTNLKPGTVFTIFGSVPPTKRVRVKFPAWMTQDG